jgi:hypothetical protein
MMLKLVSRTSRTRGDCLHSEGHGVGCTMLTSTLFIFMRSILHTHTNKTCLHSWDAIRQTTNITDSQLTARFRATALYHTLSLILPTIFSTSPNDTLPEGFDLDPSQCLSVPLMPETSSRFPGMPVEMVGELARDFRDESSAVERMKLEDVYFRVRELAMEDLGFEMR